MLTFLLYLRFCAVLPILFSMVHVEGTLFVIRISTMFIGLYLMFFVKMEEDVNCKVRVDKHFSGGIITLSIYLNHYHFLDKSRLTICILN